MASAQPVTQQADYPISSPVNTAVVEGRLTSNAIAAGVMVCGDTGNGKVMRIRKIAEESLADGRKVAYFSNNDRCFGLASRNADLLRFGVNTHAVPMTANDGAFFGQQFVDGDKSMAFDFSEMSVEDVSKFLSAFIGVLVRTKNVSADVFFESLDDLIGRKRHRDKNTVNTFKSMLLRGPTVNGGNGIRVIVGATSPEEVPIETSRHTMTLIATCTSNPANVLALSNYARGNVRITRYEEVAPWGIGHIMDHQHWLWPFADRKMHMPFYLPLPALTTDAGTSRPIEVETNEFEQSVMQQLADERAAAEQKKKDEAEAKVAASRRGRVTCQPHRTRAPLAPSAAMRAGVGTHRINIARVTLNIANNGGFVPRAFVDQGQLLNLAADDMLTVPANWLSRAYKIGTLNKLVSVSLAAAAYAQARTENAAMADAFFEGLGGMSDNGAAGGLKIRLASMKSIPLLASERYDAILSSFRAYADRSDSNVTTLRVAG